MDKTENKVSAVMYELEPDQPIDISDAAFDDLKESIEKVEAMKLAAAESIVKAKEKGLVAHTERFRVLLRKLVIMDNELKAEKERKETAKLAADLDRLEAEFANEIYEREMEKAEELAESEYEIKSMRRGVLAKLFGLAGTVACMLGCIVYLILALTTNLVPFEWVWVIADAALLVAFLIIGACFARSSAVYARLAEEEEYERMLEEQAMEEIRAAEESDIAAQAFALEQEMEAETKDTACCVLKKLRKATKGNVKVSVKANPKVVLPVIAACGVAAAAVIAGKKAKKKKATPKVLGVMLDWK